jgi:alkylhydroperoxidase/carboxymuconolactone decarboxylase family protein YurZ
VLAVDAADNARLKEEFIKRRGYWSPAWDLVLKFDPRFFAAYMELSSFPEKGGLDAKTRELVLLAVDISPTHLYRPGARIHLKHAIELGATPAELMEIFELASLIGVHSVVEGAIMLEDELKGGASRG